MRGGNSRGALTVWPAVLAVAGFGWAVLSGSLASAHDAADGQNCITRPAEKSIVVASKKLKDLDTAKAAGTAEGLEPIAVSSGYTPDLAEPAQGLIPDLAAAPAEEPREIEVTDRPEAGQNQLAKAIPAETKVLSFHGITPGISTRFNVLRTWGDPRSESTQASQLKYRFDQLQNVFVHFDGDVVDAVEVELPRPLRADRLVASLGLDGIRPALLTDSTGNNDACGFPERGVVLRYADTDSNRDGSNTECLPDLQSLSISQVRIQPIKANLFLNRAENVISSSPSIAINDLGQVLKLDQDNTDAKWLLSVLLLETGKAISAEHLAAEAVEAEPSNNSFLLQHARCLRKLARYDQASVLAKQVFNDLDVEPLDKARSLREMGLLASLGSAEVAERVIPLLSGAIDLADELATTEDYHLQVAATKLLVESHLDMALYISKGKFRQKEISVPEWIERASGISEQLIACDDSQTLHRLYVAVTALAAGANLEPPIDPALWIEEAEMTAVKLRDTTTDPKLQELYDWNLGLAYFQAAQIEHLRKQADSALEYSKLAEEKLSGLAKTRDELPDTSYLMGRLYFQIGAVHAIHHEDHRKACTWYDKAADRLINPFPVTTMAGPQQHGDALVSMGVSYWNQQQSDRAIQLTQKGADLIEQAVEKGVLGSESLMVPYGNLAAMYEAQGKKNTADKYTSLAKKVSNTDETEQRR